MSTKFVMVNVGDDDEPEGALYKPDGGYVPRILFFNPDGSLLDDIINRDGNPKYKYYHYSPNSVADSMEDVLILTNNWEEKVEQGQDEVQEDALEAEEEKEAEQKPS